MAQAQAFIDTWEWNELAIKGFSEIIDNYHGRFTSQTINLIIGLELEMPLSLEGLKTTEPKRDSGKQLEVFQADGERSEAAG